MTGSFPANVAAAIKKVSTTAGPPTENNIVKNAAADGGNGATTDTGSFSIPYLSQTGLILYAPMQGRPGTKITAKTASRAYPTSSVVVASTLLPTPKQTTTFTMSMTFSTNSHANTVSSFCRSTNHDIKSKASAGFSRSTAVGRNAEISSSLEGLTRGFFG